MSEYEATGDSLRQTSDIGSIEKALRYYGKALSTAREKSLITKMPSLFLKMGDCHKDLALAKSYIFDRMVQARFASRNIGFALRTSITKRGSTQSDEWVLDAVNQAQQVVQLYLDTLVPEIGDNQKGLVTSAAFADELANIQLPKHPYLTVRVAAQCQVSFKAYDLAAEALKKKN